MFHKNFHKPDFRREIRLGLVVYGGLSLAIYMNGVCREFYNAVRGRGIYKLIKALTDSDIVVDIMSGTSAGGINGVLLSYALTNSTKDKVVDFAEFADIWCEDADILKLMRQPDNNASQVESIFDGEGYYQNHLKSAFDKAQNNQVNAPKDEWLSEFNELDLFVTGTDVSGRVYKVFDDTGSVIEIKDHHTLFHLKYRQGRKEPFNAKNDRDSLIQLTSEQTHQALAKLCRITSCFPLAFSAIDVELKGNNPVEQKLVEWGQLDKRELPDKLPQNGYYIYFVDGGVLDNRPFSYTVKEMYYRTANRPVERKLFYIDPNPERFTDKNNPAFNNTPKPNTWQVIEDSLIGIPTYESIGKDLQLIIDHNEKVSRYKSILKNVETNPNFRDLNLSEDNPQEEIYMRCRLISLRDRILPLVLRMEQDSVANFDKQAQVLEKTANMLTERLMSTEEKNIREQILQAFGEQIRNLDVQYALRKHFYIIKKLCQLLEQEPNHVEYKKLQILSNNLSRQIKILEVIQAALDMLLSYPQVSQSFYNLLAQSKSDNQLREQFYARLVRLHRFLLDIKGLENVSTEVAQQDYLEAIPADFFQTLPSKAKELDAAVWLPRQQISSVFAQLKQKVNQVADSDSLEKIWVDDRFKYDGKENEDFCTILLQVELATSALINASQVSNLKELGEEFQKFRDLDRVLYPFEYLTDISEKEKIQTIRISPNDAQMGLGKGKDVNTKLAGKTLHAFGGFFKKSWRSNDILWGRLDGMNRIIEALVTSEAVKRFPEFLKRQAQVNNFPESGEEFEFFKQKYFQFILDESLPHAKPNERQKIIEYLEKLATPGELTKEQLNDFLEILVLEGHREILSTDLQNILEDEIEEQLNWNLHRVKSKDIGKKPKYQPVTGYFDRTVSTLAATTLAKEAVGDLSREGIEDFFRKKYRVGSETLLDSVPANVLANISTRFSLILRNVVLTTLGSRSQQLRKIPIYQVFDKSLQLFYWWLQLTGPLALQIPTFRLQRPIILVLQIVLLLLATLAVWITVSKSPVWGAIALGAIILYGVLGIFWGKNK